ncbi:unnamed protein product, partial [Rotaria sp. Silwood1]
FEMFTQSLGSTQQAKHEIDLNDDSEYSFVIGHQIDGRCLFPGTSYLVLVWKTFAKLHNYEDYRQISVLFEQIQIHRATICLLTNKIIFYVNILPTNGTFEITENNTIIVTGRISLSEQLTMQKFHKQIKLNNTEKNLQTNEIYRDFNLRGYEYSGLFRGINQINIDGTYGELIWNNEWISYLDTMLQVHLITSQGLQLPTRIDSLRIDPKYHLESISSLTSTCSVYVDYWNSLCFSGGIELFGLHCTATSKKHKQQNTILESYLFVPFDNINITDELEADDCRWPQGQYGLPTRNGKLKEVDRFDVAFFNLPSKQAHNMNPQLRLLLEVTYESICNAGINPIKLKGTKTDVFIGANGSDAQNVFSSDPQTFEDYRPSSYTVDTACSSSLLALDCALNALRNDSCHAAIVGGVNLCFRSQTSVQFLKLHMLSNDGTCRAFDSNGTGYVRSETIATIFIQKRQDAKRLYATLLHSKTNADGWKKDEIHLDPNHVGYVEAHGTGARANDPQEMNSITEVFCSKRHQPLLIDSTKSNMGHPEPASGVAALAKLLVALQNGHIPANLHYNSPNRDIPGLCDGRLKVVTEKTKLPNNLMAINSYGFGGTNVHAILQANSNRKENENLSRNEICLAFACARTADGCENILKNLKEYENNIELQALITENSFHPSRTHTYRGFTLLNPSESSTIVKKCNNERRLVWFVFSGMGTQWSRMERDLMKLKLFRQSIERSSIILKKYNIDLFQLILSSTPRDLDHPINNFVSIAAIQIALVDCLKTMDVEQDGIVGHSVGELAEETILAAYVRGKCVRDANLPAGGMAAVGLTWDECKQMYPSDIVSACYNTIDTVTVSVAFHSHYMMEIAPLLKKCLENVIINPPKQRSSRWISSSVPENQWNTSLALTSSPDYHVNNLCSPVLFQEALQYIPSNAIVTELAPHCLLLAILKRSLSTDCVHINLMKRGTHDHITYFYSNLGKLYNEGVILNIMSNYESIQYPVPINVPFISLIAAQWDHSQQWKVPTFEMFTQSL